MSSEKRTRKISTALQPPSMGEGGHLTTIDETQMLRKVSHDEDGRTHGQATEYGGLRRVSREQPEGRKASTYSVIGRKISYVPPENLIKKQVRVLSWFGWS